MEYRKIPEANQPIDIYTAKLTITKTEKNSRVVVVQIRFSKRGRERKNRKEKIPFPEDIKDSDLYCGRYRGKWISVYHRIGAYKYTNMENSVIPISPLGQRLEMLVHEVYFKPTIENSE